MKRKITQTPGFAACTFEIKADGKRVQLLPAGSFRSTDTRPADCAAWVMNDAAARRVMDALAKRRSRIVIDYEHQTYNTEQNGQPAPAAGWMDGSRMEWDPAVGLFALDVEWTERAAAMIAAGEYRYISPVFAYDQKTGEILYVFNAALTNNPGLDGLEAVSLSALRSLFEYDHTTENPMNEELLKLLRQLLGLPDDASEADILAALQQIAGDMKKEGEGAATMSAILTGFKTLTTENAALKVSVAAALKNKGTPDPAQYVPISVVTDMQTQMAQLTQRLDGGELDSVITAALTAGQLLPSMESWARELGGKDLAALKAYVAAAAPIAALSGQQNGGEPPAGGAHGLTAVELKVATLTGFTAEEFAAAKKELNQ
ncbi:phage protease [Salmonella enterica]